MSVVLEYGITSMWFCKLAPRWFPYPINSTFSTIIQSFPTLSTNFLSVLIYQQPFQTQPQQPSPQQISQSQPSPTDSPNCIAETQLEKPWPIRKNGESAKTTRHERVAWTKDEEVNLTQVWVSASKDPLVRDVQTSNYFWENFLIVIYDLMGNESWNPDQTTSKWCDLRLKCTKFNEIFNNLTYLYKSELSDFDVFNTTIEQYEKTTIHKAFSYV